MDEEPWTVHHHGHLIQDFRNANAIDSSLTNGIGAAALAYGIAQHGLQEQQQPPLWSPDTVLQPKTTDVVTFSMMIPSKFQSVKNSIQAPRREDVLDNLAIHGLQV